MRVDRMEALASRMEAIAAGNKSLPGVDMGYWVRTGGLMCRTVGGVAEVARRASKSDHECGTVACLGGHVILLFPVEAARYHPSLAIERVASAILEIEQPLSDRLFIPHLMDVRTASEAATAVRRALVGGGIGSPHAHGYMPLWDELEWREIDGRRRARYTRMQSGEHPQNIHAVEDLLPDAPPASPEMGGSRAL